MPRELYGPLELIWTTMLESILMIVMVMSGTLMVLYVLGNCIYLIYRRQENAGPQDHKGGKGASAPALLGTEAVTPFLEHKSVDAAHSMLLEELRFVSESKTDFTIWQEALLREAEYAATLAAEEQAEAAAEAARVRSEGRKAAAAPLPAVPPATPESIPVISA